MFVNIIIILLFINSSIVFYNNRLLWTQTIIFLLCDILLENNTAFAFSGKLFMFINYFIITYHYPSIKRKHLNTISYLKCNK